MSGSRCQIIILEGNLTYGVIEKFEKEHLNLNLEKLGAAVQASCSAILHASLYFTIEEDYNRITNEYTDPIIALHRKIKNELPNINMQNSINELANQLVEATRKTYELFED